MGILNPTTVIAECLETSFSLKTYVEIMDEVRWENFSATSDFRKKFNGFYRVRQKKAEWYARYYQLMEEQKSAHRSFKELLEEMYTVNNTIEVSFVSKMMATVDEDIPIWDQYVIQNLGFKKEWDKASAKKPEVRIDLASDMHRRISERYEEFLKTADGAGCIEAFDLALPDYKEKLSSTKKIDYMLWSKR